MANIDKDYADLLDAQAEFSAGICNDKITAKALRCAAQRMLQLRKDVLVLSLRLMGESESTFAPETAEVMKRWKPETEKMLEEL